MTVDLAQAASAVESALHGASALAGEVRALFGFDLYRVPIEHPFLRSLALPRGDPTDWSEPVAELVRACGALGLSPRIELLAEWRPALRATLEASGFAVRFAVPVLVGPPGGSASATPPGVQRLTEESDKALLFATLSGQHAILGAPPPSPAERRCWRACLADGQVRTWVALDEAGRPAAAASLLGPPPVVELAGLWTRPELRRRGLARRLASAALAGAAAAGCELVWAGAATAASQALLTGLGLARIGTLESWERPAPAQPRPSAGGGGPPAPP